MGAAPSGCVSIPELSVKIVGMTLEEWRAQTLDGGLSARTAKSRA